MKFTCAGSVLGAALITAYVVRFEVAVMYVEIRCRLPHVVDGSRLNWCDDEIAEHLLGHAVLQPDSAGNPRGSNFSVVREGDIEIPPYRRECKGCLWPV